MPLSKTKSKKSKTISSNKKITTLSNTQQILKDRLESEKSNPNKFKDATVKMCEPLGSTVLMEIPSQLVCESPSNNKGSAVAILCPDKNGYSLFFAICQSSRKKVQVIEENIAPSAIAELAWSYARVLSLLPNRAA